MDIKIKVDPPGPPGRWYRQKLPEGIKNNDAYQLMDYACNLCKKVERIWNGRNAVSPFGVKCNSCGGTMTHINWHNDVRNKNYVPAKGQRYFVDFTRERAEEVARKWTESFQKTEYAFPPEEVEDKIYKKIHELMNSECSMDLVTKD